MNEAAARREIWLLFVLLVAGAILYFFVIPKGIADPDGFGIGQGLPPSFTARVAVILIGLILSVRLIQLLVNPAAANIESSDPIDAAIPTENSAGLRNVTGIVCALIFAFILVPTIGYYFASIVMIAALMWVMGETRWLYIIGQPIAVIVLVWVLFDQVFSIKLPVGWILGE